MAIELIDRTGNAQSGPRFQILPPVREGLLGWWDMTQGGVRERCRNKASMDALATRLRLPGEDLLGDGYLTLGQGAKIDTGIILPQEHTLIVCARPVATAAEMADGNDSATASLRPTFISNHLTEDRGSFIWVPRPSESNSSIAVRGTTNVDESYTDRTATVTMDAVTDIEDWACLVSTVGEAAVTGYNKTKDKTGTISVGAPLATYNRTVLIGGTHDEISGPRGAFQIAQAAIYSGAMSAGDVEDTYQFMKEILELSDIPI